MFELGIVLLIFAVIALVVFYTAAPEPFLRTVGIILLIAGLAFLLLPVLLDAADDADAAVTAVKVLRSSWS